MKNYGTKGKCSACRKVAKMHTKKLCMRCYSRRRLKDPEKKQRQRAACKKWADANKEWKRLYFKRTYAKRKKVS